MGFSNIVLGTSRKFYTHNMSFDSNTTMEFGVLQPLLSQLMFPKSKIKVSSRQLVRLAPMPTPSFARMYLHNYATFVKMTDVVPYFESLLSKIPFSTGSTTYTPTSLPVVDNKILTLYILSLCPCSVYVGSSQSGNFRLQTMKTPSTNVDSIINGFNRFFLGTASSYPIQLSTSYVLLNFETTDSFNGATDVIYPTAADYSVVFKSPSTSDYYMICFRFTSVVKRLRKILIGLGFKLDLYDTTPLCFAPLLAYYKSYFNLFGLSRDLPFETTKCFELIKRIENYSYLFTSSRMSSQPLDGNFVVFKSFLAELSECWYTSSNSYIAAQRDKLYNGIPLRSLSTLPEQNGSYVPMAVPSGTSYKNTSTPYLGRGDESYISQLSLDVLKRLSAFVNKDSAIGKRMSDWVRVHYGADVSNSLFEDSFRINEWRTPVDIEDVFSTSDTADIGTKDKGEFLGAYAGKGSGFSKSGFSFTAPVHGYCFVMSCLVPVTNTFQGTDPSLLGVDLDTFPQPEFDALGYEATPRSVFFGDNDFSVTPTKKPIDTFGFIPRYSGFKVKKNIVNGDMARGYFRTDLLPYFNDRLFYNTDVEVNMSSSSPVNVFVDPSTDHCPNASTEYQKICRYDFLGDYNRLFYNSGQVFDRPFGALANGLSIDDNFIVQTVFDVRVSNFLKPIQNSYDTIDEDVDNNTSSVSTI